MIDLFYDFETYYSQHFSLSKITPPEYILSPEFETLGCSFAFGDDAPFWVDGPNLPAFLDALPWDDINAVCHNGLFDHIVLAWRYHKYPKLYGDSMSMARAWVYWDAGANSLKELAKYHGQPPKWGTLLKTKGINYDALVADPALHAEVKAYACDDLEKCRLFYRTYMQQGFPPEQLEVIDMIVRMAAQPRFILDQTVLHEYLGAVQAGKAEILARTGLDNRQELMSDDAFAGLLMNAGIEEPPTKVSPTTGETIWAFAKSDWAFTDLLEHEDLAVQALVAARLSEKSTIEETRTQRLIAVSNQTWLNGSPPCSLPVPLKFSGAHTHRFSGDWKFNLQNLKRGGELRKAIRARPGEKLVSVDASQVECRVLATLAGEWDLVEAFQNGDDVYAQFAGEVFGIPDLTKDSHPRERFIGKTGVLQLGYGAGWVSFQTQVRVNSQSDVLLDDNEAQQIVRLYRRTYSAIKDYWDHWDRIIPLMADPDMKPFKLGPIEVVHNCLWLPSGLPIHYKNLRKEQRYGRLQWVYDYGRYVKILYGAKVVENVVQALAFWQIVSAALRVKAATSGMITMAHQVHDELLFGVPERAAGSLVEFVKTEISRRPEWLPLCPLAAEGGAGDNYLEVK